jgi:peptidoglycan/xylan/chitin deacetylase (PgdA/CDA1 family)
MSTGERAAAFIVNYHYCHPPGYRFPGLRGITPEVLDRQIAALKRHVPIVSLGEAVAPGARRHEPVAVLTFDDALKDLVEHAVPVLERHSVTATFYVASGPYVDRRLLQVHRIHVLQGMLGAPEFQRRFEARLARVQDITWDDPEALGIRALYPHDTPEVAAFKRDLNYRLPYPVVDEILGTLVREVFGDERVVASEFYLSLDDIDRCVGAGLELGLHSHQHRVMSRLDATAQQSDLGACRDFFASRYPGRTFSFAYPYGVAGTWDTTTVSLVAADAAMSSAVTLGRRVATDADLAGHWQIPRFDNRDLFTTDDAIAPALLRAMASEGALA